MTLQKCTVKDPGKITKQGIYYPRKRWNKT